MMMNDKIVDVLNLKIGGIYSIVPTDEIMEECGQAIYKTIERDDIGKPWVYHCKITKDDTFLLLGFTKYSTLKILGCNKEFMGYICVGFWSKFIEQQQFND